MGIEQQVAQLIAQRVVVDTDIDRATIIQHTVIHILQVEILDLLEIIVPQKEGLKKQDGQNQVRLFIIHLLK